VIRAGLLGWPVAHSLSPRLHHYWLRQYVIDGSYDALPVEPGHLAAAFEDLKQKGFAGVNLTVPHKEDAVSFMRTLDADAKRVGAVNTILFRADHTMEGRNTDAYGFSENLRAAGVSAKGKTVVLLGAGGAARAALAALGYMGVARIRLMNRTKARAEQLAEAFSDVPIAVHNWGDAAALESAALLVNATSLGLKGQPPLELSLDSLPREAAVTDMVYVPLETELLKRARLRGHKTVDGLGMLLHQARPAFAAFFGKDPDVTDDLRRYVLARD
jgi:shikimate dehydrogenase